MYGMESLSRQFEVSFNINLSSSFNRCCLFYEFYFLESIVASMDDFLMLLIEMVVPFCPFAFILFFVCCTL